MTASSLRAGTMRKCEANLFGQKSWGLEAARLSARVLYVIIAIYEFLPPEIVCWGSMGFAFAVLAFFTLPHYRQGESSIAGKRAYDFPIELNGKSAHLSDLRGKVVVLNFWATWCPPCVEETPALIQLNQHIASRNGMVLGVSVDEDQAAYLNLFRTTASII